jgi:hypothetical protein
VGTRFANHPILFYPQKLELTFPTCGGRSADIVSLQAESHGVCLLVPCTVDKGWTTDLEFLHTNLVSLVM